MLDQEDKIKLLKEMRAAPMHIVTVRSDHRHLIAEHLVREGKATWVDDATVRITSEDYNALEGH